MAKALVCLDCGAVKTLAPDSSTTTCDCPPHFGQVVGWWVDQNIALAQIAVLHPKPRDRARVLLLHNGVLRADVDVIPSGYAASDGSWTPYDANQTDTFWRQIHTEATHTPPRPESLQVFSQGKRACWAVVQRPGTTPDTHWATDTELRQRGLLREPAAVS